MNNTIEIAQGDKQMLQQDCVLYKQFFTNWQHKSIYKWTNKVL